MTSPKKQSSEATIRDLFDENSHELILLCPGPGSERNAFDETEAREVHELARDNDTPARMFEPVDNQLIEKPHGMVDMNSAVVRHERMGGVLNYYERRAA